MDVGDWNDKGGESRRGDQGGKIKEGISRQPSDEIVSYVAPENEESVTMKVIIPPCPFFKLT